MKLLLHTCCAPCSIQCVDALCAESKTPDLFWYNPNIHPYTEYHSRFESLKIFAGEKKLTLLDNDEYGLRAFIKSVFPFAMDDDKTIEKNRCEYCYRLRLEKTACLATENSYDAFSTTLLISPYQNHELIKQIGNELASAFGVDFLYRDFRPRFRESQNMARQARYYMQKYCGCIFSEEERYLTKRGDK